ncbi:erythromycin esterase family protein [Streptomyces buecherae]|uniref:erythromycin esterase family protein n=1 Tax=Streptomyces buecherae TaxID=2763006 RepID=UPI003693ED4A
MTISATDRAAVGEWIRGRRTPRARRARWRPWTPCDRCSPWSVRGRPWRGAAPAPERSSAENVLWWHRHTGHRVLFWSASSHTARAPGRVVSFPPDPPGLSPNAGGHLHTELGGRYLSIGLTFGAGELAPYTGAPHHRVPAPVPPLVESVLHGAVAGDSSSTCANGRHGGSPSGWPGTSRRGSSARATNRGATRTTT